MLTATISPGLSRYYKPIILDYLNGSQQLKPFYRFSHQSDSFDEVIQERTFNEDSRRVLSEVLAEQYHSIKLSQESPVRKNLEALKSNQCFTVTTGHQLCLLTGPVYVIYKIIHAIRLADTLRKRYPAKQFVPVFWMASEDHDFEEISSIRINHQTLAWDNPNTGMPTGTYSTQGMDLFFDELERVFNQEGIPALLGQAREIYRSSPNLSQATFRLMHHLFEAFGLVVLEPNHPKLKQALIPVMESDMLEGLTIQALQNTNDALQKTGYPLQVNGRKFNFFYLANDGRKLLTDTGHGFATSDHSHTWTREQLGSEIRQYPERFSPNVVLRPVYQELILPNLVYIGGPGELAYWLQLQNVFKVCNAPFPMLLLRNSFALISASHQHQAEKLGLPWETFFQQQDDLRKLALQHFHEVDEVHTGRVIDQSLQQLIDRLEKLDNKLSSEVIAFKSNANHFFHHLGNHIRKSKEQRYAEQMNRVYSVQQGIVQDRIPAERIFNLLHYARKNDAQALLQMLYEQSDPVFESVKVLVF